MSRSFVAINDLVCMVAGGGKEKKLGSSGSQYASLVSLLCVFLFERVFDSSTEMLWYSRGVSGRLSLSKGVEVEGGRMSGPRESGI